MWIRARVKVEMTLFWPELGISHSGQNYRLTGARIAAPFLVQQSWLCHSPGRLLTKIKVKLSKAKLSFICSLPKFRPLQNICTPTVLGTSARLLRSSKLSDGGEWRFRSIKMLQEQNKDDQKRSQLRYVEKD